MGTMALQLVRFPNSLGLHKRVGEPDYVTAGQYWSSVLFPANHIDRDSGLLPLSILVDEDKGIS